jgi:hypothetical protein
MKKRYVLNDKTGKLEEVTGGTKKGKYAMPLDEYCRRRPSNNAGKGDWPRSIDPNGEDFGQLGCRQGRGIMHPMVKEDYEHTDGMIYEREVCKYCGKTKEEIKKLQEE